MRSCLPLGKVDKVEAELLSGLEGVRRENRIFRELQGQIMAYFEGVRVDLGADLPIVLDGFSVFGRAVLTACRSVTFGSTISYGELARRAGKGSAVRAAGGVMARNPLPLIIPCHRVIRSDGRPGGFSAAGGVEVKWRLLEHEKGCLEGGKSTQKCMAGQE